MLPPQLVSVIVVLVFDRDWETIIPPLGTEALLTSLAIEDAVPVNVIDVIPETSDNA